MIGTLHTTHSALLAVIGEPCPYSLTMTTLKGPAADGLVRVPDTRALLDMFNDMGGEK